MRNDLTAARLRELLHFDAETGVFTRLMATRGPSGAVGARVGWLDGKGHRYICVEGVVYAAHRLAWLYAYGIWPRDMIDHINGEKDDNRLPNLRDVGMCINMQNKRHSNNSVGLLGVSKHKKRFRACIEVEGKNRYLGLFLTPELAHAAYVAAKRQFHEGCTI
jgi:hypothetical protein